MKTILFYWSKGAEIRRRILRLISDYDNENKPCYLNVLADELSLSHVAIKKHLDLLREEGYVEIINPEGKPNYLKLSKKGIEMLKELGQSRQ